MLPLALFPVEVALLLQLVLQSPALRDGDGDEDEVLEAVVHRDAVLVDDAVSGRDAAAVALPQDVLHVLAHLALLRVEAEGEGEDGGAAAVSVHFGPRLEGVLVHEGDVPLVEQGVFHLKGWGQISGGQGFFVFALSRSNNCMIGMPCHPCTSHFTVHPAAMERVCLEERAIRPEGGHAHKKDLFEWNGVEW